MPDDGMFEIHRDVLHRPEFRMCLCANERLSSVGVDFDVFGGSRIRYSTTSPRKVHGHPRAAAAAIKLVLAVSSSWQRTLSW